MIDKRDWKTLTHEQQMARVADGFVKLIEFCGGDLAQAQKLTLVLHQGLTSEFLAASLFTDPEQTPLRLPDGRRMDPLKPVEESWQVTLRSEEAGGELSVHFDYSGERYRAGGIDGERIFLEMNSSLHYVFDATVLENGGLALQGPVHYSVNMLESTWHDADYPELVPNDLRSPQYESHDDLLAFARHEKDVRAEQDILMLDLLNAFHERPSRQKASEIVAQLSDRTEPQEIATLQALQAEVQAAVEPPSPELIKSIDVLRENVIDRLGQGLLPRFVAAHGLLRSASEQRSGGRVAAPNRCRRDAVTMALGWNRGHHRVTQQKGGCRLALRLGVDSATGRSVFLASRSAPIPSSPVLAGPSNICRESRYRGTEEIIEMGISAYIRPLSNEAANSNKLFVVDAQNASGKIKVERPVETPDLGVRFLASLSGLPVIGSRLAVRQASAVVEVWEKEVTAQLAGSRACLHGFVHELQANYGAEIADLCQKAGHLKAGKPLTERQVRTAIETAEQKKEGCRSDNAQTVSRFLEGFDWQAPDDATENLLNAYVIGQCVALPAYSQGKISEKELNAIAAVAKNIQQTIAADQGDTTAEAQLHALKLALSSSGGEIDPVLHEALAEKLAECGSFTRFEKQPAGQLLGSAFAAVVMSEGFVLRFLDAQGKLSDIVNREDWSELDENAKNERLKVGFAKLVQLCGNEERANALALRLWSNLRPPFLEASKQAGDAPTPLRLLDGTKVTSLPRTESLVVTLGGGRGEALAVNVDYTARDYGRMNRGTVPLLLDPQSRLHCQYDASFEADNRFVLTAGMSYSALFLESDWHGDDPANADVPASLTQPERDALQKWGLEQLPCLNRFNENPSMENFHLLAKLYSKDDWPGNSAVRRLLDAEYKAHYEPLLKAFQDITPQLGDGSRAEVFVGRVVAFRGRSDESLLSELLTLYEEIVAGDHVENGLGLSNEQLDIVKKAYAEAVAPISERVTHSMGNIRNVIIGQLGEEFLPDFVANAKLTQPK